MDLEHMSDEFRDGYQLATLHSSSKLHRMQEELDALLEQLHIERGHVKDLKELLDRMRAMMLGLENRA